MAKLYKKSELWFALVWVIVYAVGIGTLRGNFGDTSPIMPAALAVLAVVGTIFIKTNHLEKKYGLCKWRGKAANYWFFIPMIILMTGNLWGGVSPAYSGMEQVWAVLMMALVGYVEEIIFRGFLFRVLLKSNKPPVAILISAVTFGAGHIVNLLTGHATLETAIQIVFAIVIGFIFTFLFYKSGSLWICIIAHSLIDVFSKFAAPREDMTMSCAYWGATVIVAFVYGLYLGKKPAVLEKE